MTARDYLGFAAAALTTSALLPQAWKTWRTRSADDLSLVTYIAMFFGVALWLIYGITTGDGPIIAANGVGILIVGSVLAMKIAAVAGHRSMSGGAR
jgi:MtN3 and saliva related transmembrane protein